MASAGDLQSLQKEEMKAFLGWSRVACSDKSMAHLQVTGPIGYRTWQHVLECSIQALNHAIILWVIRGSVKFCHA